ncbi:MAG: prolyl oligopeptidase family serine peptidase [Pseudoxanthomonas sp.]
MIGRRRFCAAMGGMALAATLPRAAALAAGKAQSGPWPLPPQARRVPVEVGRYGIRRIDDYAWLRPRDWQAVLHDPASLDPPIKAQVLAENAYAEAMLAPTRPLQRRLGARIDAIDAARGGPVEVLSGGFLYYQRTPPGSDYPLYLRRPAAGGREQVLLDVGAEAAGAAYYALSWYGPARSPDGRLYGWAADRTGSGIFSLRVREIDSGRVLVDDIANAHGEFCFSPDGRYLYWVGRSDKGRPSTVYRRDITAGTDALIYEEPDTALFISLRTTAGGGYVVIRLFNGEMTEVWLVPMAEPTAAPVLVEPRTPGLTYDVDEWDGRLLILTDADGAEDLKLMQTDFAAPGRAHWRERVPHRPGRLISAVHPFAGYLVREEWRDALPRLVLMATDGSEREIAFDEPAYAISVPQGQGGDAPSLTFVYQSPRTPPATYRLDLAGGRHARVSAPTPAGAFKREHYEVRRIQARTDDGVDVPITVLMRAGQRLDGSAPLYLYGYGSYGISVQPEFDPAALALVDQGWVYAIAHVRGGAERGNRWWRSVLKHGKKKTFTDFIACAEHLIAQGYTRRQRIVIHGYSAGGLLAGAVYAMRPDLWAGAIAQAPFVDALSTLEDFETHPLGTTALPIWGDPRVPEDLAYVASYSPYDQLKPAAYPALLAVGGVADDRVAFWEPLKFATKARALTTAGNPILSKTETSGGHGGASGAGAAREQKLAFMAFAIWAADRRWGEVPQRPKGGEGA